MIAVLKLNQQDNSDRTLRSADVLKAFNGHDDNGFRDALGVLADFTPASTTLGIANPYACSDCKKIRFEGGIGSNAANKGLNAYL